MNVGAEPMSADGPGLLDPAETSLLIDQHELAMAASYFRRGMNAPAVFELFVRHLPPHRQWLLATPKATLSLAARLYGNSDQRQRLRPA
jgi:nicotinic acid phosphoribosyltransferase